MSQVDLTELRRAGRNLRRVGSRPVETDEIVAGVDTGDYSVLYLRSGEKLFVQERLEEIERLRISSGTQREVVKRFKREMRECKAAGMPVDQAFAAVWEEVSIEAKLSASDQANLYQELLDWTKRWLK